MGHGLVVTIHGNSIMELLSIFPITLTLILRELLLPAAVLLQLH